MLHVADGSRWASSQNGASHGRVWAQLLPSHPWLLRARPCSPPGGRAGDPPQRSPCPEATCPQRSPSQPRCAGSTSPSPGKSSPIPHEQTKALGRGTIYTFEPPKSPPPPCYVHLGAAPPEHSVVGSVWGVRKPPPHHTQAPAASPASLKTEPIELVLLLRCVYSEIALRAYFW